MTTLEVISTVASTAMSMVVAVVALIFSYRQNVGWPPVALVTGSNMSGTGGSWKFTFSVTVEFWNRRKYPIALRTATADLSGVTILNVNAIGPNSKDYVRNNCAFKELKLAVQPAASETFTFEVDFEDQSLDALRPLFEITIKYFDPSKNRRETLSIKHRFFYPEMGWAKSDQDRQEIARLFEKSHAEDRKGRGA